ncbi:MAG: ATP-binding cassette domain-containing protein, partial [Cyanobacteria bacterium P01_F01_bin.3]
TLALVGASGAGKSTLADLLPRFYDPTAGTIELDGVDLKAIDLQGYRSNLGIVSQETFLFNASVRYNLLYGRPEATEADLIQAAKQANAYEFIQHLPQGFDTMIGDRGVLLSGGQRQRLAIARALLQDPDILILDEATSALDTVSERLVQNAIDDLSRDRTTLVIAHRLSTIYDADQIAVLDQGQVVEVGTHSELLEKRGAYARLHTMQLAKTVKENGTVSLASTILPTYRKAIGQSSYELRSQLNSMLGLLALMQEDLDEPYEQAELLAHAQGIAVELLKVVENLESIATGLSLREFVTTYYGMEEIDNHQEKSISRDPQHSLQDEEPIHPTNDEATVENFFEGAFSVHSDGSDSEPHVSQPQSPKPQSSESHNLSERSSTPVHISKQLYRLNGLPRDVREEFQCSLNQLCSTRNPRNASGVVTRFLHNVRVWCLPRDAQVATLHGWINIIERRLPSRRSRRGGKRNKNSGKGPLNQLNEGSSISKSAKLRSRRARSKKNRQ